MNVSENIVNVLAINQNLRQAGFGEHSRQAFTRGAVDVDSHNLVARNHAVAQMQVGKFEGVLKYFHLLFHRGILVLTGVDGFLQIGIEFAHGDYAQLLSAGLDAKQAHKHVRQRRRKPRYGIKHGVAQQQRQSKGAKRIIRVDAENGFRQKLAHN